MSVQPTAFPVSESRRLTFQLSRCVGCWKDDNPSVPRSSFKAFPILFFSEVRGKVFARWKKSATSLQNDLSPDMPEPGKYYPLPALACAPRCPPCWYESDQCLYGLGHGLTPPEVVGEADDVVLSQVLRGLHLDQIYQDLAVVFQAVVVLAGMKEALVGVARSARRRQVSSSPSPARRSSTHCGGGTVVRRGACQGAHRCA